MTQAAGAVLSGGILVALKASLVVLSALLVVSAVHLLALRSVRRSAGSGERLVSMQTMQRRLHGCRLHWKVFQGHRLSTTVRWRQRQM